ncbi:MAG: EpsG family protein [Lachnospiraceae bacterium]|nr:EpsG family protein [Lachnospiraceae bacterium]
MALFIGVTLLTLVMSYFCNNTTQVQLNMGTDKRKGAVVRSRQRVLNLWICAGIYIILTALSACRIASGNDYWEYTEIFSLIAQYRPVATETGFNWFVRGMQALFGREQYLPIFAVVSIATVFFFVKSIYDQGEWFLGTMFLFLTNGYYFSSFNSIRYYLVLAIAMYTMKFVLKGEYGKFIVWICFAALFHKSVLLVIPVYLLAKWLAGIRFKLWHYVLGAVFVLSFVVCKDLYREIIFFFYEYYEGSAFDVTDYSLANIAKCLGTILLSAICYKTGLKDNERNRFYFFLNIGGLVLYTVGAFIPTVTRVAYYLIIGQVFLIPSLLMSMKDGIWKKLFIAGVALVFMAYFALFLKNAYTMDIRLLPYLNWIFN